ncbi:hypothetical protein BaRGS_00007402 [Batillaria attramentaria]|uniref:Uncharacterized protein n=1 Tax=Batillaria attramentaria TaxID=370345 RepID=A0ABD0LPL3_9CAEN
MSRRYGRLSLQSTTSPANAFFQPIPDPDLAITTMNCMSNQQRLLSNTESSDIAFNRFKELGNWSRG